MVTLDPKFFRIFAELVAAMSPYLREVVFIGGVANALYEFHPKAQTSGNPTLVTKDIDLATPLKISQNRSNEPIAKLLDKAGFKIDEEILMADKLTKFRLLDKTGKLDNSYEVEFLCPLVGRSPGPDYIEIQKGISANPLRFMDLPLLNPWELEMSRLPGLGSNRKVILIPNPGTYIVQKFITMFRRSKPSALQKDAFYIYEFCLKFRDSFPLVNECIDELVKNTSYRDVKSFRKDFSEYFKKQEGEGISRIVKEAKTLPFEDGQFPPDAATVHAIILRFVDIWSSK